jgi:linoleate 9S-lipoxygenase
LRIISEIEKLIFDIFIVTGKGKVGKQTFLEPLIPTLGDKASSEKTFGDEGSAFGIHFEWDPQHMGIPGAVYVENFMQDEFFLIKMSLEDVATQEAIFFVCNSWVYNAEKYNTERIFFSNKVRI